MIEEMRDRLQQYWARLREDGQLFDAAVTTASRREVPRGPRRTMPCLRALDTPTALTAAAGLHRSMLDGRRMLTICKKLQCPDELTAVVAEGERVLDWYFKSLAPFTYAVMLQHAEPGPYEACHVDGEPIWPMLP
jgi:hypothetical protein